MLHSLLCALCEGVILAVRLTDFQPRIRVQLRLESRPPKGISFADNGWWSTGIRLLMRAYRNVKVTMKPMQFPLNKEGVVKGIEIHGARMLCLYIAPGVLNLFKEERDQAASGNEK